MNNPFDLYQNKDARTEEESRRHRIRVNILIGIFCCILFVYVGVLYWHQIVNGDTYLNNATISITRNATQDTVRGEILDANGKVLITNELSYSVTLDPTLMGNQRNETLSDLIALCREEGVTWTDSFPVSSTAPWAYTRETPFRYDTIAEDDTVLTAPTLLGSLAKRLKWVGDPTTSTLSAEGLMTAMCKTYGIKVERIDPDTRALLGVLYELSLRTYEITYNEYVFARNVDITFITRIKESGFPGVNIRVDATRRYTTDNAPHVLGRIGAISPDEWPTYRQLGYPMDAYVGKSGVELAFEQYLHGSQGTSRTETDENGNLLSQEWLVEPDPGDNVILTISQPIQETTENLLEQFVTSLEEPAGAAAVMVDMTGGVLSMASYPTFDLSTYSENFHELLSDSGKPLLNRATQGLYAPGSTFKPLTAIAALSSGVIDAGSTVYCGGRYTYYPDVQPVCWILTNTGGSHGTETVSKAITDSCNIFFYDVGRRMGIQTLVEYATQFGLGQYTGIEIAEYRGHVAGPDTSAELGQTWYGGNTMYASIGQENNQFTPLQLANYLATLINGGKHYQAHLLKEVKSSDYSETVLEYEPVLLNTIDIRDSDLAAIKRGMYNLSQTYTMSRYFSALPVSVGCKTGTAEVAGSSATATFICFAPLENPEVALCIVAEKGASGGSLASMAAGMLAQYFAIGTAQTTVPTEGTLLP